MPQPSPQQRFQDIYERLGKLERHINFPWYTRLYSWVVNHTALSIVLCLVGLFGGGYFSYWLEHKGDTFNSSVDKRIDITLKAPGGVLATLAEVQKTANETNTTLKALQPLIQAMIVHQFENVSKLPTQTLIQRAPALRDLAVAAKTQNVSVDPKIIEQTGARLVRASTQDHPAVWDAALRFVDYKSFNNNSSPFLPDTTKVKEFRDRYIINIPTGAVPPKSLLKGLAPADRAAQTGYIGEDRNKGMTSGPAWIVFEGGEAGLDGIQLRNVVFHNVQVSYYGAPLVMENVYFVDCTFKMNIDRQTQSFALALLAPSPSTSFEFR